MRDFLEIFFKRLRSIIAVTILSLVVVTAGNYLITPKYESSAAVFVRVGREAALPTTIMGQPLNVLFNRTEQVNNQIQILKSRHLVTEVLSQIDPALLEGPESPTTLMGRVRLLFRATLKQTASLLLEPLYLLDMLPRVSPEEQRILDFQNALTVTRERDTEILRIAFRHPDPKFADHFLDKFLAAYMRSSAAVLEDPESLGFFAAQANGRLEELQNAELALANFRSQWNIFDLQVQKSNLAEELSRIGADLRANRLALNAASEKLALLQKTPIDIVEAALPDDARQDPTVVEKLKSIVQLEGKRNQASDNLGRQHPSIKALDGEITAGRQDLVKSLLGTLRNEIAGLEARDAALRRQESAVAEQARLLDSKGIEMAELETKVDLLRKNYVAYSERRETSRINTEMDQKRFNSVSIVQPPVSSFKPVAPKRMLNLLLGGLLGLILGSLYAFLSERATGVVNNPDDLKKTIGDVMLAYFPDASAPKS